MICGVMMINGSVLAVPPQQIVRKSLPTFKWPLETERRRRLWASRCPTETLITATLFSKRLLKSLLSLFISWKRPLTFELVRLNLSSVGTDSNVRWLVWVRSTTLFAIVGFYLIDVESRNRTPVYCCWYVVLYTEPSSPFFFYSLFFSFPAFIR